MANLEALTDAVILTMRNALGPVVERLTAAETRLVAMEALSAHVPQLRERVAVLETRAPVPGPPGKDGADGLGWDDLTVTQDGERSFSVRALRGEQVKTLGTVTFPVDIYRGVWVAGQPYERGDGVTWAGSEWHCHTATTTKPGDGSAAWTLKVKRGRDGRDGKGAA